jgi:hypothetical protein
LYIDDMETPDNTLYVGELTIKDVSKGLDIGNDWPTDDDNPFNGKIDEVQISIIRTNDPPNPPSNPSPDDGATDVDVDAALSWECSDPDGDDLVYDVYFEANDPTPDELVSYHQSQTYYNPPGQIEYNTNYYWQIVAEDEYGATTNGPIWSFTTRINNPPSAPIINGPTSGKTGQTYSYTFVAVDPDEDDVYYEIDWGDGIVDPWDGPHGSNVVITRNHVWDERGDYTIRARAKDEYDAIGNWSEFEVTITKKSRAMNVPFLNWFQSYLNLFPILKILLLQR